MIDFEHEYKEDKEVEDKPKNKRYEELYQLSKVKNEAKNLIHEI